MHCLVSNNNLLREYACWDEPWCIRTDPYLLSVSFSNDVDVIVFSVYEHAYKQCSDDPMGTYTAPVPEFLGGYLSYYMQLQQDKGYDYELPDAAQYTTCTLQVIQNQNYYLKMGCTDGTSQGLSVNIYSDNTCTTRSNVDGYDDANIDVSEIQVSATYSSTLSFSILSPWSHLIWMHFFYRL